MKKVSFYIDKFRDYGYIIYIEMIWWQSKTFNKNFEQLS